MAIGAEILLSVVVGLSVLALFMGTRTLLAPGEADQRLQDLIGQGQASATPMSLRQLEMRGSLYQRAIKPTFNTLLQGLGRLAPKRNVEVLHRKLETAGHPGGLGVADFYGLKILTGFFVGVLMILLLYQLQSGEHFEGNHAGPYAADELTRQFPSLLR